MTMTTLFSKPSTLTKRTFNSMVLGTLLVLGGCGGGGGGAAPTASTGGDLSAPPVEDDITETIETTPPAEVTSTSEIVVPKSFAFSDSDRLQVSVQMSDEIYLSICEAGSDGASVSNMRYEDCVLRTWVRSDDFQANLNVPPHVDYLVASVLVPSDSLSPRMVEWHRDSGLSWVITE